MFSDSDCDSVLPISKFGSGLYETNIVSLAIGSRSLGNRFNRHRVSSFENDCVACGIFCGKV